MVAFTFDDGPYTPVTGRILDVLKEYDSHATFFIVGNRISSYTDTLKRIYEEGHQVASHTWSHKNLKELDVTGIQEQINKTEKKLNQYVPVGSVMLRPPYGATNEIVRATVSVPMIHWSVDSLDWQSRNTDAIIEQVLKDVSDGDIILMHDLYDTTAAAVEYLVPELIQRGYQLVTVEEMFAVRGQELSAGKVYYQAIPKR